MQTPNSWSHVHARVHFRHTHPRPVWRCLSMSRARALSLCGGVRTHLFVACDECSRPWGCGSIAEHAGAAVLTAAVPAFPSLGASGQRLRGHFQDATIIPTIGARANSSGPLETARHTLPPFAHDRLTLLCVHDRSQPWAYGSPPHPSVGNPSAPVSPTQQPYTSKKVVQCGESANRFVAKALPRVQGDGSGTALGRGWYATTALPR